MRCAGVVETRRLRGAAALAVAMGLLCVSQRAACDPIVPTRDDEVIETLPATSGVRSDERRMRKLLAARPKDARLAVEAARRDLDRARVEGDPRYAGLATAALAAWPDPATAPDDVLLLQATIQQYLHEFDLSRTHLQTLLERPSGARMAQAWLTLATVLRVQGRYAESDSACQGVTRAGAEIYGRACLAENAGLRGDLSSARRSFAELLADPRLPAAAQGWLLTSVAELEERDGRASAADAAFRGALQLGPDAYAAVAYADFLIDQDRPAEALAVLGSERRTDAVLLRLAIAGVRSHAASAAGDVAEMRDRIELANQRPDASKFHGREQAMFALAIDHAGPRALALARGNVVQQREAVDLLVYARAAAAASDASATREVRDMKHSMGLYDRRTDALL